MKEGDSLYARLGESLPLTRDLSGRGPVLYESF